jgi:hypothetical protein
LATPSVLEHGTDPEPDHKGRPALDAGVLIMAHDRNALAAYRALRKRGLSPAQAELQIERVFEASFRRILLCDPQQREAQS